ncbi:hypothetical protein EAH_00025970 [Eimeria acervulina]|uniref:Uncharacterized protein n=1 Tax=Eimeria acervulina TaxID=5801 RepID=U6GDQ8_EIMAC|nr:hypothetical protein EAH_00025970 [Eimeria acervulina]CDI77657.1 hypothetical protein EAH_00025970 [Eimeria acervulina]
MESLEEILADYSRCLGSLDCGLQQLRGALSGLAARPAAAAAAAAAATEEAPTGAAAAATEEANADENAHAAALPPLEAAQLHVATAFAACSLCIPEDAGFEPAGASRYKGPRASAAIHAEGEQRPTAINVAASHRFITFHTNNKRGPHKRKGGPPNGEGGAPGGPPTGAPNNEGGAPNSEGGAPEGPPGGPSSGAPKRDGGAPRGPQKKRRKLKGVSENAEGDNGDGVGRNSSNSSSSSSSSNNNNNSSSSNNNSSSISSNSNKKKKKGKVGPNPEMSAARAATY